MNHPLLALKHISVQYQGLQVLNQVELEMAEGELVALMGPNGAGKSTILKAIFGLAPISHGSIEWNGSVLHPVSHQMAQQGIVYVPQGKRVFPSLSVKENIEIGLSAVASEHRVGRLDEVFKLFPVLRKKQAQSAGHLSGGEQQMVALARGLVLRPKLLLLDEPTLGLAPKLVQELFEKIHEIHAQQGMAMMIVEHNLRSLLHIADRGYVLDRGRIVAHDLASRLQQKDILAQVVLGAKR